VDVIGCATDEDGQRIESAADTAEALVQFLTRRYALQQRPALLG
jgi:hypothetical protein